jgi:uncharacterized membrane protein YqgA involved in biofilm formation
MSNQAKSIMDGLAAGLGFVGTFGFAIDFAATPVLLVLDIAALTIYALGRIMYHNE